MSTDKNNQVIAAIPRTKALPTHWEGFRTNFSHEVDFGLHEVVFRRRGDLEEDPSFKQIIPQVLVTHKNRIFLHKIPQTGGEARLHGKMPIFVGGHVEAPLQRPPGIPAEWIEQWVELAAHREVAEELGITEEEVAMFNWRLVGLINLESSDVSQVHIGVVWIAEGQGQHNPGKDEGVEEGGYVTWYEAEKYFELMTDWSKVAFEDIRRIHEDMLLRQLHAAPSPSVFHVPVQADYGRREGEVIICLPEASARWLFGLLQNPLPDLRLDTDDPIRLEIGKALLAALPKAKAVDMEDDCLIGF